MSKPSTKELLSPFTFTFVMIGGCVALFLLATAKKKTPIGTVSGLPPYEGPPLIGASRKRTDEDIARHWDRMAEDLEALAKNETKQERKSTLELAADYRSRATRTRAGKGAWSED